MSDSAATQAFLDMAYAVVAARLREPMQRLIQPSDDEMRSLDAEMRSFHKRLEEKRSDIRKFDFFFPNTAREEVARIAFMPIAQQCVVAMLRAMFERSRFGTNYFHKQQLQQISQEISDHSDFSQNLGLSYEDTRVALGHTTTALLSDHLFTSPTTLVVDDNAYRIHREEDHLVVQLLEQA